MQDLNRKSKKVLKAAIKAQNSLHYIPEGSKELFKYLPTKYNLDIVDNTLLYLDKKGYLNCNEGDCTICSIEITYEGQNYREFRFLEIKSFLMRSILTPIIISIITTLVALLIKGTFK